MSAATKHTKFVVDPQDRTWDVITYVERPDGDDEIQVMRREGAKTVLLEWVPVYDGNVYWEERTKA